jgi:hypothetical protein
LHQRLCPFTDDRRDVIFERKYSGHAELDLEVQSFHRRQVRSLPGMTAIITKSTSIAGASGDPQRSVRSSSAERQRWQQRSNMHATAPVPERKTSG